MDEWRLLVLPPIRGSTTGAAPSGLDSWGWTSGSFGSDFWIAALGGSLRKGMGRRGVVELPPARNVRRVTTSSRMLSTSARSNGRSLLLKGLVDEEDGLTRSMSSRL